MKNRTLLETPERQIRIMDWVYQGMEGGDDFLMNKIPQDLSDTWEDEG